MKQLTMRFSFQNRFLRSFLIVIVILQSFLTGYSQNLQKAKEVEEAIRNAKDANYEQAIPALKKYAEMKGFDDFKTLEINVYLNWCYIASKNEAINLDKVNSITDAYLQKYGLSKTDIIKRAEEVNLLLFVGTINSSFGDNERMIFYLSFIFEYCKKNKLTLDQSYSETLFYLARRYYDLKDYKTAIGILEVAWNVDFELKKEQSTTTLNILDLLYLSYRKTNQPEKSLEHLQKEVEIGEKILGEKNSDYLTTLYNLASFYLSNSNYQKALEINLKVVELGYDVWGEKNKKYFASLSNLASIYDGLGEYRKALEIYLKYIEKQKEVVGEMHIDYLVSLNNLASVYLRLGDYQKALEIYLKVVELRKQIGGEKNSYYLTSLSNLALCYTELGDYSKALENNLKVVELRKEVLGEKNRDYIKSLNNLASSYNRIGDTTKALQLFLKVVSLGKEVFGENNIDYLTNLSNLAYSYSALGDFQKALEIEIRLVDIAKEVISERQPEFLTMLNNLASFYLYTGDYTNALIIDKKTLRLREVVLGEKHPDYLLSLNNLAVTEFYLSEYNSALMNYLQMLKASQKKVIEYLSILTEYQREKYWKKYSRSFMQLPMFLEKEVLTYPEGASDEYNIALFSKGLLLNTTIDFDNLLAEKGTPEAIAKFDELKIIKLVIQRLTEKPITERYINVDSLENIAQQKETELVKLSKEYGDYTGNLKTNWKDVQANLQDKDVAIEFVEYPTLTDTVKYAALVLRKGWQYPRMITLFRKDQIDEFIKLDKDQIYSKYVGKKLKKLIWDPLEEIVTPGERVYFSPAGIIYQLAIENLPVDDSSTLGDIYQMYRLSSTKELALQKKEQKNATAVLYGGLLYDLDEKEMAAESRKYELEKGSSYLALRGYQNDTAERSSLKYLDYTKPEVDRIADLMKEKHYQVTEYTGERGNEESFKSLSGKKVDIIHIATHGFFESIVESRKNLFMIQRIGDEQQERATVDPMLRSGLIMAGGNKAWQGEKILENIEDGVLTAKEISRMDLRGTDLVVLSACETGLGEVSSEGVFGLQRSFKQAGVQTLVMSLWQVNDEATRYLMTEFYSELLSGKDKRAAFLEAKQKCKNKYMYPKLWAAFIMLD